MHRLAARRAPELPFSSGIRAARMERLWSLAVATSGNRWQMQEARKTQRQAKTVATGCDQLPIGAHGKEGVDGSSSSEGFIKGLQMAFFVASTAYVHRSSVPQPVPKICPQHCRGRAVLA
jgi:hypothetical protein